jgi:hypothetical protein
MAGRAATDGHARRRHPRAAGHRLRRPAGLRQRGYFHAGVDTLAHPLDRNSFNSGDWFNRIDLSYRDNYFGTGCRR